MKLVVVLLLAACGSATPVPSSTTLVRSPAIVDSHVHLALWPGDADLAAHGVLFAVDLGAPDRRTDIKFLLSPREVWLRGKRLR